MGGLVGGLIGFLLFKGIWGAMIGYMIGSAFTNVKTFRNGEGSGRSFAGGFGNMGGGHNQGYYRQQINQNDFATALLVLSGAVMKADGKVLKSELDYVKAFLNQQFSPQFANEQLRNFKDILKKDFNLSQVCGDIAGVMPHQQRSVLVQYLFGIAKADGHVSESEVKVIQQIAAYLRISSMEFEQLKAMFYKSTSNAYRALGIEKGVTDSEVKKAYRKMAVMHHPDKYEQMGEEHQKAAKEKFQKIQEAYETIKKERGFS
jgi:DnaJ like chaperone protein